MKLYVEDFPSVLLRFRRTPEYLSILEDRLNELKTHMQDIGRQSIMYNLKQIEGKIIQTLGVTSDKEETLFTETPKSPDIKYFRTPATEQHSYRRLDSTGTAAPNKTVAVLLDSYYKLNSELTVDERHNYSDMAYECVGDIIHTLIKNMGPDDGPAKSTRLPFGGDKGQVKTTTPHDHTILTQASPTPDFALNSTAAPDTFKYYRASGKKTSS